MHLLMSKKRFDFLNLRVAKMFHAGARFCTKINVRLAGVEES